ncbi:MAG: FtsX-like permease family protein, partial [Anaerolineae bacterium]
MIPGVMYPLGFVDPEQEARLVSLDQALVDGEYLTGREPLFTTSDPSWGVITYVHNLPVLLNATPYVSQTVFTRLSRVVLPPELTLEEVLAKDDPSVVETLPVQPLWERSIGSEEAFSLVIEVLREGTRKQIHFPKMFWPTTAQTYTEVSSPFPQEPFLVEADAQTPYRYVEQEATSIAFSLELKGIFHLERLGVGLEPVNRVPLGMYVPPLATLRYDESGRPTEPIVIRPTFALTGPVPLPPLALTTLEAARLIAGDNCISAIRVRVGGIDQLTPEAQRKIEAVASEIHRRTGLDVDIMVGSSPRRVLVRVPGIGYVEEQWVQKNVTLSYHRRIQSGHLLLITALLLTGGLFAADLAWADLLARQPVLALQKAVGWRSGTLMGRVLGQALLVGLGAGLAGTALAAGVLALARQPLPPWPWLVGIPLLVTALSLLGSLYPA